MDPDHPPAPGPRRGRMIASLLAVLVLSTLAALVIAPRVSASGPVLFGDVTVTGGSAPGRTRLVVPPVGALSARTHHGPLGLSVRVDSVDLQRFRDTPDDELATDALTEGATRDVGGAARAWWVHAVLAAAVLGLLCGLVVAAVVRPPRARTTVLFASVGSVVGAAVLTGAAVVTWRTYDASALDTPTYSGALEYAPEALAVVRGYDDLAAVRDSVAEVTDRLELFARVTTDGSTSPAEAPDVVLLHVSDLHLNPLGMQLTVQLAERFRPDAIVDSGDFTSFGVSELEGLFADLAEVDVPYLLVPGNHDSAAAVRAAASTGRVRVVDGDVVEIGGLRLGGLADPTFTPRRRVPADELADAYRSQLPEIRDLLRRRDPDVVVLHNPSQAAAVVGEEVTVLSGHIHENHLEADGPTRLAVVGSTGAGGIGALAGRPEGPYRAQLLGFRAAEDGYRLVAVDRIAVDEATLLGTGPGRSTVERLDPDQAPSGRFLVDGDGQPAPEGPIAEAADEPGG